MSVSQYIYIIYILCIVIYWIMLGMNRNLSVGIFFWRWWGISFVLQIEKKFWKTNPIVTKFRTVANEFNLFLRHKFVQKNSISFVCVFYFLQCCSVYLRYKEDGFSSSLGAVEWSILNQNGRVWRNIGRFIDRLGFCVWKFLGNSLNLNNGNNKKESWRCLSAIASL